MRIRVFISLTVSDKVQSIIADIQAELKEYPDNQVTWTKPHLTHLTLKFLGDVEEKDLHLISTCLNNISNYSSPIRLNLTTTGVFPTIKNPNVMWIGVGGSEALQILKSNVENKLSSQGFQKDAHELVPHLTLGRIRKLKTGTKMIERFRSISIPPIVWMVNDVKLMSSRLTPTGVNYKTLSIATLKSQR